MLKIYIIMMNIKKLIATSWLTVSFVMLFVDTETIPLWIVLLIVLNFGLSVFVTRKLFKWNS